MEQRGMEFDIISNEDRRFLGLDEIQDDWTCRKLGRRTVVYLDGMNAVRKRIVFSTGQGVFDYLEARVYSETEEDGTILKPKKGRGKGKRMTASSVEKIDHNGMYFHYLIRNDTMKVLIGNNTSHTSFFHAFDVPAVPMKEWIERWKTETTAQDKAAIAAYRKKERMYQDYREGDIFKFRVGRRRWGFGQIMFNPSTLVHYDGNIRGYGMPESDNILCCTVFKYISDSGDENTDFLMSCRRFPAQFIYDNHILFGDYEIIGNRPCRQDCWEPVIHYGCEGNTLYLRRGMEVKTLPRFLVRKRAHPEEDRYSKSEVGFHIEHYEQLEELVEHDIDFPEGKAANDLRSPENRELREYLMSCFGYNGKGWRQIVSNILRRRSPL